MGKLDGLLKGIGSLAGNAIKQPGLAIKNEASSLWKALRVDSIKSTAKVMGEDIKTGVASARASTTDFGTDFVNMFAKASRSGATFTSLGKGSMRIAKGVGRVGGATMKGLTYGPVPYVLSVGALAGGVAFGAGTTAIQRANDRAMASSGRGMAPNNLSTDGLTLSLSRCRHR